MSFFSTEDLRRTSLISNFKKTTYMYIRIKNIPQHTGWACKAKKKHWTMTRLSIMHKAMKTMPKIILQIEPSRASGRGLMRGIAEFSNIHGPWMFYRTPPFYRNMRNQRKPLAFVKDINADGIIAYVPNQAVAEAYIPANLHAILIPIEQHMPEAPYTISDNSAAIGTMGAQYFLSKGLRQFAYCGIAEMLGSDEIGRAFCRHIAAARHDTRMYVPPRSKKNQRWEQEQIHLSQWLVSLPKPIGLMTCNDDRSQEILELCEMIGISVPDDIAILGVDNDEFICNLAIRPLSSVAMNFERVGYRAAELLDRMIRQCQPAAQTLVIEPTHVVTRQSTDVTAIDDPDIAHAVRYIRRHARGPIGVEDVANAVALSRRTLYERFMRILGHSVHQEIKNVRLEQITKMLIRTDMPISTIADSLGFSSVDHISRYFKRTKGLSLQRIELGSPKVKPASENPDFDRICCPCIGLACDCRMKTKKRVNIGNIFPNPPVFSNAETRTARIRLYGHCR